MKNDSSFVVNEKFFDFHYLNIFFEEFFWTVNNYYDNHNQNATHVDMKRKYSLLKLTMLLLQASNCYQYLTNPMDDKNDFLIAF